MQTKIFLMLALLLGFLPTLAQKKQPNIIIIVADDLGWGDVGFNGSDIKTPHLDALAREGVVLNRFYVSPICSPTRVGIMTGRLPERYGLRDNVIAPWLDFGVDTTAEFLPQMLAQAGYKNRAALGKWHLGHSRRAYLPLSRGFTHFYGHYNGAIDYFTHEREGELDWHENWQSSYDSGYATDLISQKAVQLIQRYKNEGPFMLYIAYNAPHGPLQAKEADLLKQGFDPGKPVFGAQQGEQGSTQHRGNTRRQTYAAMVSSMDAGIGAILATLKKEGLSHNTLVVFQSDNGGTGKEGGSNKPLRGAKFQEWEGGVRVPAIIRWPNAIKGGWASNQLMGYIDWVPTLRQLVGIAGKPPMEYDGKDVSSAILKKRAIDRSFYLGHGSLIRNQWKLVYPPEEKNQVPLEAQLFNILKDPLEKTNLSRSHPEVLKALQTESKGYQSIQTNLKVPPYDFGRKGFKAPKEWNIQK